MKSLILVTFSLYSFCLWLIFASSLCTLCICNHNSHKVQCMAIERLALTQFKNNLVDKANRLSSWSGEDCCSWSGVVCDKFTHHVQELRLRGPDDGIHGHCNGSLVTFYEIEEAKSQMLGGIISPSLIKLEQLEYLDLSSNDFGFIQIPTFIGMLENLRYLDISNSRFFGKIPHQLGNLSSLLVLDVHTDQFSYLVSTNLKWIENLKQLQYLDMGGIELIESSNWLHAINTLSSLQELHLSSCGLTLVPRQPLTRVNFTSLIILDISHNYFYGLLPEWVSSLRKLIMLDFSGCSNLNIGSQVGFDRIPSLRTPPISQSTFVDGLNTLSNLRFLDISNCDLYEPILGKLQNLSLIVHLDLSNNHIVEKIPKSVSNLCNLTTLDLKNNNFSGDVTQLLGRFCECQLPKLESLALSANLLTGQLPEKLGRLKNLVRIDLAYNKLTGILPRSLGSLSSLKTLQLNVNQLKGSIPDSVGDLASLEILDLSYNRFSGNLPESIGKLGKLISLDLRHNSLAGIVTENHLSNLTTLSTLWVEENKLAFDIVNSWIPPFQLKELRMGSCSVGLLFPSWVQSQTNLVEMHLANTNISDTIPNWIWSTFSYLIVLNISHNNIKGKLGDISTLRLRLLDLSSNHFHGEIPSSFNEPHMEFLDLSSNSLSGSLDQFLCSNIREQRPLRVLNLADNNISGGLPDCWTKWETLAILNLQNNKLFGEIPPSLGNSFWLQSLDIRNNKLSGKIPVSLLNSESLVIVKLANNELTGRIPTSIVRKDRILKILSLRSNKLSGEIPKELCRISSLQILDFANNNFSGYLPKCFTNFTVISGKRQPGLIVIYNASLEHDETVLASATLVIKGQFYSYSSILYLVTTFDLSNNNLYGSIPNELVSLPGLRCLNLSHNKLSGIIPNTFGAMRELESLDLSVNHLNGEIPLSLAGLSGLSWLNMSYNNLTGTIPIGRQLQTFNETSFIGNALCGAPLAACRPDSNDINGTNDNDDEANDTDWILVICMTVGLVVGFWITIGTLIVSKQWRYTYYGFLDEMKMKLSDFIFFVSMSCKRVKFWV